MISRERIIKIKPPVRFANSTHTDGHRLLPCGHSQGKITHRFAIMEVFMPKGHAFFCPGNLGQVEIISFVCVRLWLLKYFGH